KLVPTPRIRSARSKKRSTVAGRVRARGAECERVVLGKGALAVERRRDGRAGALRELHELVAGACVEDACPAKMTGCDADVSIWRVFSTSAALAWVSRGSDERMLQSASPASPFRTSLATATSTGPLRTERNAFSARRKTSGPRSA